MQKYNIALLRAGLSVGILIGLFVGFGIGYAAKALAG
jgi:hypothetical protein